MTSQGMLPEVRRLGDEHHGRYALFILHLRETYRTLYETDIKLTSPLKDESGIVDQDQPDQQKELH